MIVKFFDEHIKQFIRGLAMPTSAKIFRTLELLERFGHMLSMPHSKHITGRLFELRVRGVQEVRLIYTFRKGMAVILHGFFKKSNKIPRKEIDLVHQKLSTL
ncbi:type II toxin-antitoxin system RelE/ParE family toxin, partial [Candidatus Uhrbacteria bacterium]|nr:type II toxin-antitoxin system RelE/ParE family toxin [Candidatus Uhrbacteria bacterium]